MPAIERVPRWVARQAADWINERSRLPGILVSAGIIVVGLAFGGTPGLVLGLNWSLGKLPMLNSARVAWRIRDIRRWSHPQTFQEAQKLPPPARRMAPALGNLAGASGRWHRVCRRSAMARFVDDWLKERTRVPGFFIGNTVVLTGLLSPLPRAAVFILDWGIGQTPHVFSIVTAVTHRSLKRYSRPGAFPREAPRSSGLPPRSLPARQLRPPSPQRARTVAATGRARRQAEQEGLGL
jgi:hypothetical protein